MSLKPTGLVLCAAALATPLVWFPALAAGRDSIALFSQYLGIWALIAMALAQIISTRLRPVEMLFGGLDRAYFLHKWLGISAMVMILLHDTIDAEMRGLGKETLLVEFSETLGEISLYGLLILVVITVVTFIPYHLWRWTHKLMGAFFVAGAFHYLFILKPFANGDPLGLYTSAFCVIGTLAFAYRLLPSSLRPTKAYSVSNLEQTGTALAVTLTPEGGKMHHRAGQFAFVSFNGGEPHPFTLSSAPRADGSLRMSIADLGDFTHALPRKLTMGTKARIEGPYGRFERPPKAEREIWIAGGIGITPFLALAEDKTDDRPVDLVYCVRDARSAAHLDELRQLAAERPNLTLHPHESRGDGRITADAIQTLTGADMGQTVVSFCGPEQMREALRKGFAKLGLSPRRFRYEEFEIRTGLGLKALARHLLKRLNT